MVIEKNQMIVWLQTKNPRIKESYGYKMTYRIKESYRYRKESNNNDVTEQNQGITWL